ncbi:uncharacterized protein G2W53_042792 [Senna tora]|uniref:Uncharacterized protein n=1 Tax=Senna tora TaxID=362788 RepID=A0A834SHT2_9FABA|nr:uncharacterized protein G2W53_042792 [Senna tora]
MNALSDSQWIDRRAIKKGEKILLCPDFCLSKFHLHSQRVAIKHPTACRISQNPKLEIPNRRPNALCKILILLFTGHNFVRFMGLLRR